MSEQFLYGDYDFQERARCTWGESESFERPSPGGAQRSKLRISLVARLSATSDIEIDGQLAAMRAALTDSGKALVIVNGAGEETLRLASVEILSRSVPEGWRHYAGEVTVEFEGTRVSAAENARGTTITFLPMGAAPGVEFPNVEGGGETINSERYDAENDARRLSRRLIAYRGRLFSNPEQTTAERRTFLLAERARLLAALDVPQGSLIVNGVTEAGLFVESGASVEMEGDLAESLAWSVSFSKTTFPTGDYAQVDYTIRSSENQESGETETTVSGTIRANTLAAAETRAAAIRAYWQSGRSLLRGDASQRRLQGGEADGELPGDFVVYDFSYTFVAALAGVLNWNITITVREDDRAGVITRTYSGSVIATTFAAAQAKARAIGDGKHPIRISREEAATYEKKGDTGVERFIRLNFSYVYEEGGSVLAASVSITLSGDRFSTRRLSVRGDVTASTSALCSAFAAGFRQTGHLVVREETAEASDYLRPAGDAGTGQALFKRYSFSYEYLLGSVDATVTYSRRVSVAAKEREQMIVYNGSVWAANEIAARAMMNTVIGGATGTLENYSLDDEYQRDATRSVYLGLKFSYQFKGTAPASYDILSARYTLANTYSVNHSVITPIPFDTAHVQKEVGWTIGERALSGSISGYNEGTLRAWARGLRSAHATGEEDPPQESVDNTYADNSSSVVKEKTFSFSYRWRDPALRLG